MSGREAGDLVTRCAQLGHEIETLVGDSRRSAPAASRSPEGRSREEDRLERRARDDRVRTAWETSLSARALDLLRDLRDSGFDHRYLPAGGLDVDPESAERWQAASEARDFLRTERVDTVGLAHLARYFRLAADELRDQQG